MSVGPDIENLAGKLMNQDQDGLTGEAEDDIFKFNFIVDEGEHLFWESFEEPHPGWEVDNGIWEIGEPTYGPPADAEGKRAYEGSNSLATVLSGNYPLYADSRVISPVFVVPALSETPRLRFWHWFSAYGINDKGFVEIREVGTSEWVKISRDYANGSAVWTNAWIDLSEYASKSVQIAFHFQDDGATSGYPSYVPYTTAGWYIDEVEVVTGASATLEPNVPEGFEGGLGDWSVEHGVWQVGEPSSGPPADAEGRRAHEGRNSLATVLSGNYPLYADSRVISPVFLVPALSETPRLRFWHWFSTYGTNDKGFVEIREVGTSEWVKISRDYANGSAVWTNTWIDLSEYASKSVQIAFHFQDDGATSGYPSYVPYTTAGRYIDQVELRTGPERFNNPEDFEASWGDWDTDNFRVWQIGAPTSGPPDIDGSRAHSPVSVAATVLDGNYPVNATGRLISPQLDLPKLVSDEELLLRYWEFYSYYSGDYGEVQIQVFENDQWSEWTPLERITEDVLDWHQARIDLTAYAGQRVRIGFYHYDDNVHPGYVSTGWYIDDIEVSILPIPPQTIISSGVTEADVICSESAEICWTGTDNLTPTSKLIYSWKMDNAEWSNFGIATCHLFTDLFEGEHTFAVRAKDGSGHIDATPAMANFSVDLSAPGLSEISLDYLDDNVVITWSTDEPTTSQVEYGPTAAYGSTIGSDTEFVTSHSVTIPDLMPESEYYYRVKSKNSCQLESVSPGRIFRTPPDPEFPQTEITAGPAPDAKVCEPALEICWRGTDNATPLEQLQYGYKFDNGQWSEFANDTCRQYSGLSDGLHNFQVRAMDASGNIDVSPAALSFTVDTAAPTLSDINVVARQSSASVSWKTSEPITSQVEYGLTDNYGSITDLSDRNVNEHRVVITGLTAETTYHFRVKSGDGCHETNSSDDTFTTTSIQPPNLAAMELRIPPSAEPLTELEVNWRVLNAGQGDAIGSWEDHIFLSTDEVLDVGDALIGAFDWSEGLTAYFDYWRTERVALPSVSAGAYYIIIETDGSTTIDETNEGDNVFVKPIDLTERKQLIVSPDRIELNLFPGTTVSGLIDIGNLGSTDLTGVTAIVKDASSNLTVELDVPTDIAKFSSKGVNYSITASDASQLTNSPVVEFTTNEGIEAKLSLLLTVIPSAPKLVANPGYLEAGMVSGRKRHVVFRLSNIGGVPADDLQVLLPDAPWLALSSPKNIGTLAPGEQATVILKLAPDENMALGPCTGNIVIAGANANLNIGFLFRAVSGAVGDLMIIAKDEFSYFADDHPNVAGASVTLKDAFTGNVMFQGATDATGVFAVQGFPEGHYSLEVTAEKHGAFRAIVEIAAGIENEIIAFLPRQFVTYNWNVEPIEYEDTYRVTLEAKFETNVPAPVITVDPQLRLVPLFEGETETVDVTVTNHGLIAAHNVRLDFAPNDYYYAVPLMNEVGTLGAMSSVVIPVMIRAKTDGPIQSAAQNAVIDDLPELTTAVSTSGTDEAEQALQDLCDFLRGVVSYTIYCGNENFLVKIPISIKPLLIYRMIKSVLGCALDPLGCLVGIGCKNVLKLLKVPDCLCMFLSPLSINPDELFVCLVCDMSYPPIKLPYRSRPPRHIRVPAGGYPYVWHERSGAGPFIPVPRVSGPPGFSSNIRCWVEGPSTSGSGRLFSAANPDQLILTEMSDLAIKKHGGRTITYTAIGPQR